MKKALIIAMSLRPPREGCYLVGRVYGTFKSVLKHPTPPLGKGSGPIKIMTKALR